MPQSRRRKTGKGGRTSKATYSSAKRGADQKTKIILGSLIAALAVAAVAYLVSSGGSNTGQEVITPSGLKYVDLVEGNGGNPRPGQVISVHYTGRLENGIKFDSSVDRGQPYDFAIGQGSVIKGWDEGIMTMKVGGKRRLIIPPELGYGERGSPPKIPPNSTLVFDVELLGLK